MIKVLFDIRGNEYNGKYYNNLVAWKVETAGAVVASGEMPPAPMPAAAPIDLNSEEEDDLPF